MWATSVMLCSPSRRRRLAAWGPLSFNGQPDGHPDPGKRQVLRLIRGLGDMGVNFIDTAEQYGNGESERRVGEAIRGHRDKWKAVLETLVQQGKCRYYGISTNEIGLIKAMAELDMLDVLQYASNMLCDDSAIRDRVSKHNTGTQVRGVMAEGRLSGKYFHQTPSWAADDNRSHRSGGDDYHRYAVLEDAIPDGYTMAQVGIRWILDDPCNHSICLGAKDLTDYKAALAAVGLPPMTAEHRRKLAACVAGLCAE